MQFDLRRILTFGSLLIMLGTLPGCVQQAKSSDTELEKAKKLIEQGHYEAAFMKLNQVLADAPRDPEVHTNLGWLYLYTDDPAHAALELKKVQELAPGSAESYHLKGALLSYQGQHADPESAEAKQALEESILSFNKALRKAPRNYQTYFDMAGTLTALNRSEEALTFLNKGFDYIPNDELEMQVNFQIASCAAHAKLQQFEEAIADCNQAREFTENPASKARIEEMVENMRLMNPKEMEQAESPQPTAAEEKEAQEKNVIQNVQGTD